MKKITFSIFISLLLGFAITAEAQVKKMAIINGKLANHGNYTQVFLDSLGPQEAVNVTSAPISSDGSFKISVFVPNSDIYKLRLDDKNFAFMVLSPSEQIKLEAAGPNLDLNLKVKGSVHTEYLYNTMKAIEPFNHRLDSLDKLYKNFASTPHKDSLIAVIFSESSQANYARKQLIASSIRKDPSSLAWLFFIDKFDVSEDFVTMDMLDQGMFAAHPDNVYVAQFHKQVGDERKLGIGREAPEISQLNPEGKMTSLSSLRGKIVLIDFWASWCGPCRKENPNVVKLYQKYQSKGFEVFSVSLDKTREAWLKAIADDHLTWTHVSDLGYWKSAPALLYGVSSIPYTVLIDREGKIISKKLRGDDLERKLEELMP
jgi:thiol-disulfide isomerase/thioredoxin